MPRPISVRVSDDLYAQLEVFARANSLTLSQAAREVLSRVLLDADDVTRGYREGIVRGHAEVLRAVSDAVKTLG
jgi:predicted transcriptional regulator